MKTIDFILSLYLLDKRKNVILQVRNKIINRMADKKPTLQECAMKYGTMMGLFWIGKFILFPIGFKIPFIQLFFFFLTLFTPFLGYIFAKKYRENECENSISFFQGFSFTIFMYLFAALLVAVAHYIYFQFIDNGFIIETYSAMLNGLKEASAGQAVLPIEQVEEAMNIISGLSALQLTMQIIYQNIFWGFLLAFPTALLIMKRNKQ